MQVPPIIVHCEQLVMQLCTPLMVHVCRFPVHEPQSVMQVLPEPPGHRRVPLLHVPHALRHELFALHASVPVAHEPQLVMHVPPTPVLLRQK